MNVDDYLTTTRLMDCQGRTTHTLTLLIDGRVRVRVGAAEGVVDPRERRVHPPTIKFGAGEYGHDQVLQIAYDMANGHQH
ncbi:MAG: hypothetical protein ACKOD2_02060 [Ilumatobacteraceae bacterium]